MAIHITTPAQLQDMDLDLTEDYILDNDLDMTGVIWEPVGQPINNINTPNPEPFTGTFDGQGFTIRNLTCDDTAFNFGAAGLFGMLGAEAGRPNQPVTIRATVQNVNLENVTLLGTYGIGALCGLIQTAVISNVHITDVDITVYDDVNISIGGFGGDCYGWSDSPTVITDSDITNITIAGYLDDMVGGFIGNCFAESNQADFSIYGCFAENVDISSVVSGTEYGGFVGYAEGEIGKCYATGDISNVSGDGGGFVGYAYCTITDCYAHVDIITVADSFEVGGFVGAEDTRAIKNCYSSGTVTASGTPTSVGGFVGSVISAAYELMNCYSVGVVTASGDTVGGFAGGIQQDTGTITNCSWFTGAFTWAVGTYPSGTHASLSDLSYGTDEATNTDFYSIAHIVYDQGNADEWDFDSGLIWFEHDDKYPDFVGSAVVEAEPEVGETKIIIYQTAIITRLTEFQTEVGDNTLEPLETPADAGDDPLTIYETSVVTYITPEQDE